MFFWKPKKVFFWPGLVGMDGLDVERWGGVVSMFVGSIFRGGMCGGPANDSPRRQGGLPPAGFPADSGLGPHPCLWPVPPGP